MLATSPLRSGLRSRFEMIAQRWPVDPLRTNESANFGRAITRNLLSPPGDRCIKAAEKDTSQVGVAAYADQAATALDRLRQGREVSEHPIPNSILRPASDPEYYQRIRRVIEKTANDGRAPSLSMAQRIRMFFGKKPFESTSTSTSQ